MNAYWLVQRPLLLHEGGVYKRLPLDCAKQIAPGSTGQRVNERGNKEAPC